MEPEASRLLNLLLDEVSCPACKKTILDAQKGVCGHSACTSCWATQKRTCAVCGKHSGMRELRLNADLNTMSSAIMKFTSAFANFFNVQALSSESEELFKKDWKFDNINTYKNTKKKTPDESKNNLLSISEDGSLLEFTGEFVSKTIEPRHDIDKSLKIKKVTGWLNNAENKFHAVSAYEEFDSVSQVNVNTSKYKGPVRKNFNKCSSRSLLKNENADEVLKKTDCEIETISPKTNNNSDIDQNSDVLKKFFKKILPSKGIKKKITASTKMKNDKMWESVIKMKKVLKKPPIKKLNVSIEPYCNTTPVKTHEITPCRYNIENVNTVQPAEVVVSRIDSSSTVTSIPTIDLESVDSINKDLPFNQDMLNRCNSYEDHPQTKITSPNTISSSPKTHPSAVENIEIYSEMLKNTIITLETSLKNKKEFYKFSDKIKSPIPESNTSQVVSDILNDFDLDENTPENGEKSGREEEITSSNKSSAIIKTSYRDKIQTKKDARNNSLNNVKSNLRTITKNRNVPFYYKAKLNRSIVKKPKTVPYYFMANCSSQKWRKAPQEGIDIKIKRENLITSIIVRDEPCEMNIVNKRDAQTSPICIDDRAKENSSERTSRYKRNQATSNTSQMETYDIHRENSSINTDDEFIGDNDFGIGSRKNVLIDSSNVPNKSNFFKNNKDFPRSQIKTNYRPSGKIIYTDMHNSQLQVLIDDNVISTTKRSIKDTIFDSENNDSEVEVNQTKKMKLTGSSLVPDEGMVVNFESECQSEMEMTSPVEMRDNINKKSDVESIQNTLNMSESTRKLNLLKESVDLYHEADDDVNEKEITIKNIGSPNIFGSKKTPSRIKNIELKSVESEFCTPSEKLDSDNSIVEDTPQKERSIKIVRKNSMSTTQLTPTSPKKTVQSVEKSLRLSTQKTMSQAIPGTMMQRDIVDKSPSTELNLRTRNSLNLVKAKSLDTPSSLKKFTNNVRHQSTPLIKSSKRSLTYDNKTPHITEVEEILYTSDFEEPTMNKEPSYASSTNVKTALERDFMAQAFEESANAIIPPVIDRVCPDPEKNTDNVTAVTNDNKKTKKFCLSCSCLPIKQKDMVKMCAARMNWDYSENFTDDVSHLIIRVDDENKSQRSLKYVKALASGAWILTFKWIYNCYTSSSYIKEDDYVALDSSGENGPFLLKTTGIKLFDKMTFYCLTPFTVIPKENLEDILIRAGGTVVSTLEEVIIRDPKKISLLIAQPECTQEDKFMDLCMNHPIVPVNVEWVLDSLGRGSCNNIGEWIMASRSFLPKIEWDTELISDETHESIHSE